MNQVIECVPNFSEGRQREVVAALEDAVTFVRGIYLLRSEMDPAHHRAVLTFVGPPEAVCAAAFKACARAAELIDLTTHRGAHPRIGATDVIPLIPVSGISIEECIRIARDLGLRIAQELRIPVYLYGAAATRPDRENLANVRIGEFEGLRNDIGADPARYPDFGEARIHPTAGAVAVGVRQPLIAYNVNLDTQDVRIARRIARSVRERDGGLKSVKALGLALDDRGLTQVSMNLTDYRQTSIAVAFDRVKQEAEKAGAHIVESELIGLVNLDAILDVASHYLRLPNLDRTRILDQRVAEAQIEDSRAASCGVSARYSVQEASVDALLDAISAPTPVPASGSAAAFTAALGIGLITMVCGVTLKKRTRRDVRTELTEALKRSEELRARITRLKEDDEEAFRAVIHARQLDGPERDAQLERAWQTAATIPLRMVECCSEALPLLLLCAEKCSRAVVVEVGVATFQIEAAERSAAFMVQENLDRIRDAVYLAQCRTTLESLMSRSASRIEEIQAVLQRRRTGLQN